VSIFDYQEIYGLVAGLFSRGQAERKRGGVAAGETALASDAGLSPPPVAPARSRQVPNLDALGTIFSSQAEASGRGMTSTAAVTSPTSPTVGAAPGSPGGGFALPRSPGCPARWGAPGGRGGKELPSRSPCPRGARDHRQRDAVPSRFIFGVVKKGSARVFVIKKKKTKEKEEGERKRTGEGGGNKTASIQRISLRPDCTKCI